MAGNVSRIERGIRRVPTITDFPICLDVGCGDEKHNIQNKFKSDDPYLKDRWYGVDIVDYGQDFVWDIELGLPVPDGSVAKIFCSHVLEHLDDPVGVMNEFWRVLQPDGELYVIVPHADNSNAFYPTHKNFFNKYTFIGFQSDSYEIDYQIKPWDAIELNVNEKPDIHWRATPRK